MISHRYKCIFIHIPKCAGTSIERALGHLDGHSGRGGQDHRTIRMIERPICTPSAFLSSTNRSELRRRRKHYRSKQRNPNNANFVTSKQYNEYFKFTIVRNPWGRAFSWYQNVMRDEIHKARLGICEKMPFSIFLERYVGGDALRPQTSWLKGFDGKIRLDYIGKFENLLDDFEVISKGINCQNDLAHEQNGYTSDYRKHYTLDDIRLIRECYAEDITLFSYEFDR